MVIVIIVKVLRLNLVMMSDNMLNGVTLVDILPSTIFIISIIK
jgi:hypothetical protein